MEVADRPHGAADAHRLTALPEPERGRLTTMVGMVAEALIRSPGPNGHRERAHDQLGPQVIRHGPPHHAPTAHVKDHRQIEEPLARRGHVRDIGDPKLVRRAGREGALDQVGRRRGQRIALRGVERAPAMTPHEAGAAQEARNARASAARPGRHELRRHARHARGAAARLVDRADLLSERCVDPGAGRRCARAPGPLAARGDTQHVAKPADGMVGLLAFHARVGAHRSAPVSCAGDAPRLCSGSRAPRARSGSRAAVGATPPARRSSARRSVCPRRDPPA